jgi:hypothetical protein
LSACSLTAAQSQASSCQTRTRLLGEKQKQLQAALEEAQERGDQADAAAQKWQAAAAEEAQRRLAAVEAALEAVEREKAVVVAERRQAEEGRAAAEAGRQEAALQARTLEAELRIVREAKETEVNRWAGGWVGGDPAMFDLTG